MADRMRERIIELIKQMGHNTVENGCTPGEAAKFAAKVAEWKEKYEIEEAELRAAGTATESDEIEVCEHILHTGKKVFNLGMSQVVIALAEGMCCRCILLHTNKEAVYGITGSELDATYVCQVATMVVPALQMMARLEGIEHGYEKAGLVRWTNQYLTGAGLEIKRRLNDERKARSDTKLAERKPESTALIVTGETLATEKREAAEEVFRKKYPKTRTNYSRSEYDHTAHERGREAGKRVGLHVGLENK